MDKMSKVITTAMGSGLFAVSSTTAAFQDGPHVGAAPHDKTETKHDADDHHSGTGQHTEVKHT